MKCPDCGSEVRPSKKYPGKYLCDTCKKRFPASALLAEEDDLRDEEDERYDDDDILYYENDDFDGYNTAAAATASRPSRTSKKAKPKKKKEKKKKKPGLIVLLVILLLLLLAVGASAAAYFFFPEKIDPLLEKFGIDIIQEDASLPDADTGDKVYAVGEAADYNHITVSVLGYEESDGDEWSAPAEGNKFVFVNMSIANNTETELTVNSMASFENYCGDTKLDYSANAFTALATNTDRLKMDGTIASGETLTGYLSLEVPADWSKLEIHYADKVWSGNKVRFEVTK